MTSNEIDEWMPKYTSLLDAALFCHITQKRDCLGEVFAKEAFDDFSRDELEKGNKMKITIDTDIHKLMNKYPDKVRLKEVKGYYAGTFEGSHSDELLEYEDTNSDWYIGTSASSSWPDISYPQKREWATEVVTRDSVYAKTELMSLRELRNQAYSVLRQELGHGPEWKPRVIETRKKKGE